ncbi:MAG: AsnC family protein [Desulfobacteraceae bacterium 4572_130]|nr:MAG: AsnC family protein [Desulfobacteraceae bacterium 4572_130]
MTYIDDIDKKIINRIQNSFPIDSRPYKIIGLELNLSEKQIISRIKNLKKNGIIRRIGANFVPKKLGFYSTLCAAKVSNEKIDKFVKIVNSYSGVTHNYMREHKYNIWFTFIASSPDEIKKNLKEISEKTGVANILNLPATDIFKISAQFKV